ncbi:MAG: SH3 domain-containing protein [Oscillospiraceae bacterium]|jgi:hypothetical protein|nr:SH3 domain-containing protein [Oscillospiraceae bacterium]
MKKAICTLLIVLLLVAMPLAALASETPFAQVIQEAGADLRAEPSPDSLLIATYPLGTKVHLLAWGDAWCHVQIGDFGVGYMPTKDLMLLDDAFIEGIGMPEIGYAVVNKALTHPDDAASIYCYPGVEAEELNYGVAINGTAFQVLAVLGDWCQLRTATDATMGFALTRDLEIYLLEDLPVTKPSPAPPARHTSHHLPRPRRFHKTPPAATSAD